jgi:hypothetical protein
MLNYGTYRYHWALEGLIAVIKIDQLMRCREIIAVFFQIHTKHINTLCGQNVESLNFTLVVNTGL